MTANRNPRQEGFIISKKVTKPNLAWMRKGRKGQFSLDNDKVFDVIMTHLLFRFNTLRLKTLEVESLISQLLTSTAPWVSSLQSTGMNKKSVRAFLLKMKTAYCKEKFREILIKSKVESKKRKRTKSNSPVRKQKCSNKNQDNFNNSSSEDDVIPPPRKNNNANLIRSQAKELSNHDDVNTPFQTSDRNNDNIIPVPQKDAIKASVGIGSPQQFSEHDCKIQKKYMDKQTETSNNK